MALLASAGRAMQESMSGTQGSMSRLPCSLKHALMAVYAAFFTCTRNGPGSAGCHRVRRGAGWRGGGWRGAAVEGASPHLELCLVRYTLHAQASL